jgi:signal transduction histidine kinase
MSEFVFRTVLILFAQMAIAMVIGLLLWYFWRVYGRPYLQSWALSAMFFCLSLLFLISAVWFFPSGMTRLGISLCSSLTQNLHIFLVLVGALEAADPKPPKRKWLRMGLFGALGLSIAIYLTVFLVHPPAPYAVLLSIREAITAISFFIAGTILFTSKQLGSSGSRLVAFSFFLYASVHGYYSFVMARNAIDSRQMIPSFFGVVETVLISWIGFGLVIWLLEDERNRLQKMNKEMDSFLYSTSHDLRAPIASILGITNLARLEVKDEKSLEYVGMIENRVKKLDLVISDILQLSRSANAEIKYGPIDFNKLVAESMTDIKFNQGADSIALKYCEHADNTFFGDYNQMKIIIGNLLSNAVRYHRLDQTSPAIEVRFGRSNGRVIIEVEDNGEGIAEEHREKIFDMFYRASAKTDGTGLGLYIVKEALNRVKGTIDLESELGVGSVFRVTLLQN